MLSMNHESIPATSIGYDFQFVGLALALEEIAIIIGIKDTFGLYIKRGRTIPAAI